MERAVVLGTVVATGMTTELGKIASLDTPSTAVSVRVSDSDVLVADASGGLLVLRGYRSHYAYLPSTAR